MILDLVTISNYPLCSTTGFVIPTIPGCKNAPDGPAADGPFTLLLRMYVPQDIVLKGQYQIPPVEKSVTTK